MRWRKSRGCGGITVYELVTETHLLASVAKDGDAWRAWLPGERRFLNPAGTDRLAECKLASVNYFMQFFDHAAG